MKNNPINISNQGTAFYYAALRCSEKIPNGPNNWQWLMVPANVCFAFSIELNLKAITFLEEHSPARKHNIKSLFDSINGKTKTKLIAATQGVNKDAFRNEIKEISNVFDELRYYYELENLNINVNFLIKFAEVCENISNDMISPLPRRPQTPVKTG